MVNDMNKHINEQTEIMNHPRDEVNEQVQRIDVLNLPPRKSVHDLQKKRVKIKLSRPFMRFISVTLFVLLIILTIMYLLYKDGFIFG